MLRTTLLALLSLTLCSAQVYSPVVLKAGQVDSTSLQALAQGIYQQSGAVTPRDKAEAIWRFFLTDGRFVKPGFWYHIAGWAYEEPKGEVLDPIKLLNSYGFGLCYHIAPLLEAVFEAGGFADARVWFLTGHTVAEVFYDGAYHYFDSDMLGYNAVGTGPLKQRVVASVHDIEKDGSIILSKLAGPKQTDPDKVDSPWYPADLREGAIPGLTELFTSANNNWLYPFTRYAAGHSMDFVLRPGERIVRYFRPEDNAYYLPYASNGKTWREFPQEIGRYWIQTKDGPHSQKDARLWGTGRIEYRPTIPTNDEFVIAMPSPWVIIDAAFQMNVNLPDSGDLNVETSVDGGRTWNIAGRLSGPYKGLWSAEPEVVLQSRNGKLTAVSGTYGYSVRFRRKNAVLSGLQLTTRFQANPRTLPALTAGRNEIRFRSATTLRTEVPIRLDNYQQFALKSLNTEYSSSNGQGWLRNTGSSDGAVIFAIEAPEGGPLAGFDAGGRFLDLRDGIAPDKLTAEVRKVSPWPAKDAPPPSGSVSWATTPEGPWTTLWSYDPKLVWKDNQPIDRTLRWPEIQRQVRSLPSGTQRVYVRYAFNGVALDDVRLASVRSGLHSESPVRVTHIWKINGEEKRFTRQIGAEETTQAYTVNLPESAAIENTALMLECPLSSEALR